MPEVLRWPINLIRISYLHGLQLAELEFQTVFWVIIFTCIVDYDCPVTNDFHNLTTNALVLVGYKIADVDFHTVSFANECSCNMWARFSASMAPYQAILCSSLDPDSFRSLVKWSMSAGVIQRLLCGIGLFMLVPLGYKL